MAVVKAYFGDGAIFETTDDIEEHVGWLLPNKDVDEDEGVDVEGVEGGTSIEEIARQRKKEFVGAPFLWENGLIGVAGEEPVCELSDQFPACGQPYLCLSTIAIRVSFEPAHP
jgi:hypothetical protein